MRQAQRKCGVTATLRKANGKETTAVFGRAQSVRDGLYALARYCDATGAVVLTLSTPSTILADLQGRWAEAGYHEHHGGPDLTVTATGWRRPEAILLSKIGRLDLIA